MLNDRGIPNPTEYKRLKGLRYKQASKNSTLWKYFAIADMLVNEIYIGNMVQGKYGSISYKTKQNKPRPKEQWYVVKGTHEPIIDMDLWERVQELIRQRAKSFCVDGTIGLFARKARCMQCSYTLRSQKNHGYYYLQCNSKYISKESCEGAFIPVKKLEQVVISELNKLANQYIDKDEIEQKIEFNSNLTKEKIKLETEIESFNKTKNEYSKGIQELYLDKVKGIITENDYVEFSKNFTKEKERIESLISKYKDEIDEINKKISIGDNRRELIEQYVNIEKLDRETVEKLIDYILIGKKDIETGEVPIEIHWNF